MADSASMFAALKHRDFRWLWAGTFCSTSGQWIQTATLGWVVYDLTGSGTLLGAVLGIRAVPMLLLAPICGVMADRYDRRRMLAATQLLIAAASLLLAAALALDAVHIWHLFAFTFCAGACTVFDRTLRSTLVFDVVPRAEVANAVALNTIAFSVSRTLGPAVAGVLIGWVGPAWNFSVQTLLYLGVAATVFMVNTPTRVHAAPSRTSAWYEMKAGLQFAVTHPVARMMLLLGLVPPLLLIPSLGALMPVFAVQVFRTGPEGLGVLLSAVGAGGILGGVIAASLSRFDRIGLLQSVSLLIFALALVAFAFSDSLALAAFFLAVAGTAEMVLASSNVTTLQMSAPQEMRGRVASLVPVFPALISVGALTSGIGADLLGPQPLVILLSLIASGIAVVAWIGSAAIRELRLTRLEEYSDGNVFSVRKH